MYEESDLLPISALQHLLFCERQAALIHIERMWAENALTIQGQQLHQAADSGRREVLRGRAAGTRVERTVPLRSHHLGVWGKADVVEFPSDGAPRPVEYKRGRPKRGDSDVVQLAAQAICLEEMLELRVPEGALFYGQTRRRLVVSIDSALRERTCQAAARMHELVHSGTTPPAAYEKKCARCSLFHLCQPRAMGQRAGQRRSAVTFVQRALARSFAEDSAERESS